MNAYQFPPMLGHIDEVPEGSPEWAERLGLRIKLAVENAERFGVDEVLDEVRRALNAQPPPWKIWPSAKPCGSAVRFFEYVSGTSHDKIGALINAGDDPDLVTLWRRATKGQHGGDRSRKSDIVTLDDGRGNSRAYTLDRIERERPDLYARVVAKELSANAAAIEAGFRKKTIAIPDDINPAARSLVKHFGKHRATALAAEILRQVG